MTTEEIIAMGVTIVVLLVIGCIIEYVDFHNQYRRRGTY